MLEFPSLATAHPGVTASTGGISPARSRPDIAGMVSRAPGFIAAEAPALPRADAANGSGMTRFLSESPGVVGERTPAGAAAFAIPGLEVLTDPSVYAPFAATLATYFITDRFVARWLRGTSEENSDKAFIAQKNAEEPIAKAATAAVAGQAALPLLAASFGILGLPDAAAMGWGLALGVVVPAVSRFCFTFMGAGPDLTWRLPVWLGGRPDAVFAGDVNPGALKELSRAFFREWNYEINEIGQETIHDKQSADLSVGSLAATFSEHPEQGALFMRKLLARAKNPSFPGEYRARLTRLLGHCAAALARIESQDPSPLLQATLELLWDNDPAVRREALKFHVYLFSKLDTPETRRAALSMYVESAKRIDALVRNAAKEIQNVAFVSATGFSPMTADSGLFRTARNMAVHYQEALLDLVPSLKSAEEAGAFLAALFAMKSRDGITADFFVKVTERIPKEWLKEVDLPDIDVKISDGVVGSLNAGYLASLASDGERYRAVAQALSDEKILGAVRDWPAYFAEAEAALKTLPKARARHAMRRFAEALSGPALKYRYDRDAVLTHFYDAVILGRNGAARRAVDHAKGQTSSGLAGNPRVPENDVRRMLFSDDPGAPVDGDFLRDADLYLDDAQYRDYVRWLFQRLLAGAEHDEVFATLSAFRHADGVAKFLKNPLNREVIKAAIKERVDTLEDPVLVTFCSEITQILNRHAAENPDYVAAPKAAKKSAAEDLARLKEQAALKARAEGRVKN